MNKAFCRKRCIFSFLLTGCLIFFNLSCGLDTFYVLSGPSNVIHQPTWERNDYVDNYFEFFIVDKPNKSIKFLGTEVYYKIYKNPNTLNSDVSNLTQMASKNDYSTSAAEALIDTRYQYFPLRAAGYEDKVVLFPARPRDPDDETESSYKISIRLSDYRGVYFSNITMDGKHPYNSDDTSRLIPVRKRPGSPTFNFTATNIPEDGNEDYKSNGTSSDFYVSMFAVAIGQDSTYSPVYSNILYLGSVRIPVE